MADEDKQVDIEIALRDTASQTLRSISREIDNISRKLTETGRRGSEALERIRTKGGEAGTGSGKAAQGVDEFTKSIGGLTKSLAGPLGLAAAFLAVGKALTSFAQHRVELSLLSTDIGMTTKQIGELQQILLRKGLDEGAAKQFITSLAEQFQDMRTRGVYADVAQRLLIFGDDKFAAGLMKTVQSGDIHKAFNTAADEVERLSKLGETGLARARYLAREVFGQNLSTFLDWNEYRKDLIKSGNLNDEHSKRWVKETTDLNTRISNSVKSIVNSVTEQLLRLEKAYQRSLPPKTGTTNTPGTGTSPTPGPPGTGPAPTPGPGTATPGATDPGLRITVPPRRSSLDLGTSDQIQSQFASAPIPKVFAAAFKDVEESEKETNRTLISIRDILTGTTGGLPGQGGVAGSVVASLGGSPTSPAGQTGGRPTTGGPGVPGATRGGSRPGSGNVTMTGGERLPSGMYAPVTSSEAVGGLGDRSASMGPGMHGGDDYKADHGSQVYAIKDGTIERYGRDNQGGMTMRVRHTDGTTATYMHLSKRIAPVGHPVKGGDVIGESGTANRVPHLHFEMRDAKGNRISPRHALGVTKDQRAKEVIIPQPPSGQPGGWPRGMPQGTPVPSFVTPNRDSPITVRPAPGPGAKRGITLKSGVRLADTPAAGEGGWRTGLASMFDDKATATGMDRSVPGIALPDPSTKGQWFWVRDNRTGKEILTQQTDVGPAARTGRSIDVNRPLARQFGYPNVGRRGEGFPTDDPKGYSWRPALDKEIAGRRGKQSSRRDGNVKASVDFGAMQRVKEAGEIFMPLKVASFSQGSTVHRNAVLPGGTDYTRWTA